MDNIEFIMKISAEKWIRILRDGSAYFNLVDYYITKAHETGNNQQGDKYEGVFAHIKKSDLRLNYIKKKLGDDLEMIDDGDFVFLRRYSARKKHVFCMYGVLRSDIILDQSSVFCENGEWIGKGRYNFPEEIYTNFLDDNDVWGFYSSAGHFCDEIEKSLKEKKLEFRKAKIIYDIDINSEFMLDLNDTYSELNHKRKDLDYQHEIRYVVLNNSEEQAFSLSYVAPDNNSCGISSCQLYMEMNCKCYKLSD